jgi:uncharacterized MAPEG superfamily protein
MLQALGSGTHQTFFAYGLTTLFLSLNLLLLWISSGALRARGGVAINPEDGARYGVAVSETDPPAVARVLRVHRNAEATIYPFLVLGLVYVLVGGSVQIAAPIFAIFTFSRVAHSIVYLKAMQPWRTLTFTASLLSILALMVADLRLLLTA